MIRVLIVAAYASVRAGLHALLADADDLEILGEVGGSAELERVLPGLRPDVLLLDSEAEDGARVVEALSGGEVGVVILGEDREEITALAGIALPGWAYLLKEADGQEIAGAVRAVAAGLVALDRGLASLLATPSPAARAARAEPGLPDEALTARESEVLQLMAQGLPNKQIAVRLRISAHTVKFHVAAILAKLGAASRTEAVTLGVRRGHVTL
jgi:DNA-binding NarL/FixJ family response regulator